MNHVYTIICVTLIIAQCSRTHHHDRLQIYKNDQFKIDIKDILIKKL
jgi:hypothetical protein